MEHTPSPWIIKQPDKFTLAYSFEISEMTNGESVQISQDEAEANRILMQTAPELLEALEMELWAEENGEAEAQERGKPRLIERLEIMRKLIDKAKGL